MRSFLRASSLVTLVVLLGKVLALFREMLVADIFGTSEQLDIFLLVSNIPIVIFYLIGNGITTSLLPVLKQCRTEEADTKSISRSFITFVFLFLLAGGLVLFAIGQVFAREIVSLVAPGFSEPAIGLAVEYLRFFMLLVFFLGLEGVSTGVLQENERIYIPPVANLLYGVVLVIPMFVLRDRMSISLLAVILVAGYATRSMTCVVSLLITDFKPCFKFREAKPYLVKLAKLAPPVVLATVLMEINFMIDKSFASMVGVGAISALNYSEKVVTLVTGTLFSAMSFVFFPLIVSKYYEDHSAFARTCNRTFQVVLICGLACSVFCLVEARGINVALFMGGAFDERSLDMTTTALLFFAFAIVTTLIRDMLKKVSFAMQNTRVPLVGSVLNTVVNVLLMIAFVPSFGLAMIALSTTIASLVEAIFLLTALKFKEDIVNITQLTVNLAYTLPTTIVAALIAHQIPVDVFSQERLDAFAAIAIRGVVFLAITALACVPLLKSERNQGLLKKVKHQ